MKKDTIITLDDGSIYALLDELIQDEKKYYFATRIDEKNNPTTEYEIFEEINENKETYMETIENEDFKQLIIVEFLKKYMEEN